MKKLFLIVIIASTFATACSNTNTVNVPAVTDSTNQTPPPHDTASNLRDSAKTDSGTVRK